MKTTREVAQDLSISPAGLRQHIAAGNVAPPRRRAGMMFLWAPEEVEAARVALSTHGRRRFRHTAPSEKEEMDQ